MALSTTQYGYIIDPMVPFTDDKGKTIKNGFVRVFVAGSSTPVVTYRNFDGATNQDKIELDNSGRTMTGVIGSKGLTYKVCVYDAFHSQESPILTVDKVSVIGTNITAGAGATVVTGLDGLTTKPNGFVDASVVGTDGYVAIDHTLVTDDLDTDAKVTAVENDRYVPLLNEDVNDPDSKMTLGRLWQWVLGKIKSLATTITAFRAGDYIAVDGPSGTAKMSKDDLLELTAQNALAGNLAPAFDPTRTEDNPYIADKDSCVYEGVLYRFTADHYGAWNSAHATIVGQDAFRSITVKTSYSDTLGLIDRMDIDLDKFGQVFLDTSLLSVENDKGVVADPANYSYGRAYNSTSCNLYKDIRCDHLKKVVLDFPFFSSESASLGLVFYGYNGSPVGYHYERGNVDVNKTARVIVDVPATAYKFSVSELKEATPQIVGLYEINGAIVFANGYSVSAKDDLIDFGSFVSSPVTKSCHPVYCGDVPKVNISNVLNSNDNATRGLVFYDSDMTPITGLYSHKALELGQNNRIFTVPSGASFVAFTIPATDNDYTFEKIDDSGLDGFVLGDKIADIELDDESNFTQGAISTMDGTDVDEGSISNKRIRTDYFKVSGGIFVFATCNTDYSIQIFEYNHNLVLKRVNSGFLNNYIKLKDETCYIRFAIQHVARIIGDQSTMIDTEPSEYDDIGLKFTTYNFFMSKGIKKDYTADYERFKVLVNQTPLPDEDYSDVYAKTTNSERIQTLYTHATNTLNDSEKLLTTTGVIALPPSYTKSGHKTKLILFAHGGHGYVDETHWYPTVSHFPNTVKRLLSAGYAVFDCNGYKDTPYEEIVQMWNNGNVQISEGLPQVCQAYYKCYKYIVENYNVDPRIYIWGCSQGGHLAMNFGWCYRDIVAAVAVMAGQIDLYDQGYSYQSLENKRQVAKLLGFSNTTFENNSQAMAAYEHYRADKWDPMQRLVKINGKNYVMGWNIPVKFFYGTNDTILPQVQYTINLVEALQNSKVICYLRMYTGFDHSDVASGKSEIALREALEWFNRF